jgi:hypothetical protein
LSKQSCDLYCLYFLFLSSISHPGNSSQLLFLGRPGNPFPALSSHVIFTRSWDGPQHVCLDSPNLLLISHHFHVYTFWKGAVLHPVENTFILRLSCLHIFTKVNSNRDVTLFSNLYPGHFFFRNVFLPDHFLGAILLRSCSIQKIEKLHFKSRRNQALCLCAPLLPSCYAVMPLR